MKRSDGNILEQSLIYANKPQNFYFIVHQQYWKDSDPNIFKSTKNICTLYRDRSLGFSLDHNGGAANGTP